MDGKETLKTLCNPVEIYKGYSVFEIDANGAKIKMMCLKDVQVICGDEK